MIFQEADLAKVLYSNVSLALSSVHLLKSLLSKSFGGQPKDLQAIQAHDLQLNKIMDKLKDGSSVSFVLSYYASPRM